MTTERCYKIYDFGLINRFILNDSANNIKRISKLTFLGHCKNIADPDVQEKEENLKNWTKKAMCSESKKIYTLSIRKLHDQFNETQPAKVPLLVC